MGLCEVALCRCSMNSSTYVDIARAGRRDLKETGLGTLAKLMSTGWWLPSSWRDYEKVELSCIRSHLCNRMSLMDSNTKYV